MLALSLDHGVDIRLGNQSGRESVRELDLSRSVGLVDYPLHEQPLLAADALHTAVGYARRLPPEHSVPSRQKPLPVVAGHPTRVSVAHVRVHGIGRQHGLCQEVEAVRFPRARLADTAARARCATGVETIWIASIGIARTTVHVQLAEVVCELVRQRDSLGRKGRTARRHELVVRPDPYPGVLTGSAGAAALVQRWRAGPNEPDPVRIATTDDVVAGEPTQRQRGQDLAPIRRELVGPVAGIRQRDETARPAEFDLGDIRGLAVHDDLRDRPERAETLDAGMELPTPRTPGAAAAGPHGNRLDAHRVRRGEGDDPSLRVVRVPSLRDGAGGVDLRCQRDLAGGPVIWQQKVEAAVQVLALRLPHA